MNQNPLRDSGNGLNPALVAALASLEVQLEQELARYRRTRMGIKASIQSRVQSYPYHNSQQLADQNLTVVNAQSLAAEIKPQTRALPLPPPPPEKPAPVTVATENEGKIIHKESIKTPLPPSSVPIQTANTQIPLPTAKSEDNSSMVAAIAPANQSEKLLADDTPQQPDDYLESSEALLRSLTDEQPQASPPKNSNDSLLSPLGIGSMLLLLVASLTLGYVVFNPKGLPQLNFSKLFPNNSSPSAETRQINNNPQPQVQSEATPIPKNPNLAAKEFTELKNPIDVVGLQPKVQPTPIAPANLIPNPTPVITPVPQAQTPVTPLPPLDLSATPTPSVQPKATPTPSEAIAQIKPSEDGRYNIVIENQGASSLTAARKVVADAYLSRNSKLIYLATVKTKEEAQKKLNQLQAKGMKVRVQ